MPRALRSKALQIILIIAYVQLLVNGRAVAHPARTRGRLVPRIHDRGCSLFLSPLVDAGFTARTRRAWIVRPADLAGASAWAVVGQRALVPAVSRSSSVVDSLSVLAMEEENAHWPFPCGSHWLKRLAWKTRDVGRWIARPVIDYHSATIRSE